MDSTARPVIGLVTAPADRAAELARAIVDHRLAACVNVVPTVHSTYWWDGEVQQDDESLLVVKTTAAMTDALTTALDEIHPYDVFELVVVDIAAGNPAYLEWISESVQPR